MKALKPALVISLLANVIFVWLLWNHNSPDARPVTPRWNPSEDLRPGDPFTANVDVSQFTPEDSSVQVPDDPVRRPQGTRGHRAGEARPVKLDPDVPALNTDILRPAHYLAPYPSHRESQLHRGLYPGDPRLLP